MRVSFAAVLSVFASFCFLGSAEASPVVDGIFKTSGTPGRMAAGTEGEVWFTLAGSTDQKEFGRIDPDGTITEFDTPNGEPVTAVGVGRQEDCRYSERDVSGVWLTQHGRLIRWSHGAQNITSTRPLGLVEPTDVSIGNCEIWIADREMGLVSGDGRTPHVPDTVDIHAESVVVMPGGVAWTDPVKKTLNRVSFGQDPLDGTDLTEVDQTAMEGDGIEFSKGENPALNALPEPGQLGYTSRGGAEESVGLLGPNGLSMRPVSMPVNDPLGIASGPNGNYWIANRGSDELTQITPTGIYRTGIDLPTGSRPSYLASGSAGQLFVGLAGSNAIARVSGIGPAPVRPRVTDLEVTVEKGRMIARFVASAQAKVRIVMVRVGAHMASRDSTRVSQAGQNQLDLGPVLKDGIYQVRSHSFVWVPDWQVRVSGGSTQDAFRIGDSPSPPAAHISVRGRSAALHYKFRANTAVRIVIHRKNGKKLKVVSVTGTYLEAKKNRYLLGRFPKGRYVVRFTRSLRLGQDDVFTSRPTIIRFQIRR